MALTAILAGSTGVVGSQLLQRLLHDEDYSSVVAITRRPLGRQNTKLTEVICDYASIDSHRDDLRGDVLFCCLGTTQKVAGSREKFYEVDHDYPVRIGEIALANGAQTYVYVSSLGASTRSPSYYMRVKGETERDLSSLGYRSMHIVRPSLIVGDRPESRPAELFGQRVLTTISPVMVGRLEKYRPISADQIAKAMLEISKRDGQGAFVHTSDQLARF